MFWNWSSCLTEQVYGYHYKRASLMISVGWRLWTQYKIHSMIVWPRSQLKGQLMKRSCLVPAQVEFIADLVSLATFWAHPATSHSLVPRTKHSSLLLPWISVFKVCSKYDFASAFKYCLMRAVSLHVPCMSIYFENTRHEQKFDLPLSFASIFIEQIVGPFEVVLLYGQFLKGWSPRTLPQPLLKLMLDVLQDITK